ncbi:MAG TPA: O-antigen ligase family protein [Terriglobales bacterium]|nr:O-antigen ligase family protein [Terriglobales bacterium]
MSAAPQLSPEPGIQAVETSLAPSRTANRILYGLSGLLMFCVLAFGGREHWPLFIWQSGTAVLLAVWAVDQLRSERVRVQWNPLFAPMLAFALVLIMQLLPGGSSYWHATYTQALQFASYGICCFLVVQTLTRNRQVRKLGVGLTIFGAGVAVFAVLQNLSSPTTLYWLQASQFGARVYGPYVNHNHYAGLMEMLVPVPLVFAFSRFAHQRERWIAASAAAFMSATIFLSGSRGGMIALVVEVAVFTIFVFRERQQKNVGLLLSAFLLILLGVIAWTGGHEVKERLATLAPTRESDLSSDTRLQIDHDILKMVWAHPLLGWGEGTFAEVYPRFRSFYTDSLVNAAHNDYLQALVETGILGFAVVIWFLVAGIRRALRKTEKWASNLNGAVALAAVLGITGILVHSFVDFNLQIPANAALFYSLCTLAAMEPRFSTHRREHRKLKEDIPVAELARTTA